MLLAEDLLLLLTDDETGKSVVGNPGLDLGLAGANLLDLALRGRVDVAGEGESVKRGRIVVRDRTPTGEPLLDEALRRCGEREGKRPDNVLQALGKGLREELLTGLAARGVLRAEQGRVLGIFPTTRWPAADSRQETQLRELVIGALINGTTPDERTAAVIALLSAVDAAHKVIDTAAFGADKRLVKKRAKTIREGAWAAGAVVKAIEAVQAAVVGAIIASTVASTSGYG